MTKSSSIYQMSCWVSSSLMHPLDLEWRRNSGTRHARQANRSVKLPSLFWSFFVPLYCDWLQVIVPAHEYISGSVEIMRYCLGWWTWWHLYPTWHHNCQRHFLDEKREHKSNERVRYLVILHRGFDVLEEENDHHRDESESKSKVTTDSVRAVFGFARPR